MIRRSGQKFEVMSFMSNELNIVEFIPCPNCECRLFKYVRVISHHILIECGKCEKRLSVLHYSDERKEVTCPKCGKHPPRGAYWRCGDPETKKGCCKLFDTFDTNAECPYCHRKFTLTSCPLCEETSPFEEWKEKK